MRAGHAEGRQAWGLQGGNCQAWPLVLGEGRLDHFPHLLSGAPTPPRPGLYLGHGSGGGEEALPAEGSEALRRLERRQWQSGHILGLTLNAVAIGAPLKISAREGTWALPLASVLSCLSPAPAPSSSFSSSFF